MKKKMTKKERMLSRGKRVRKKRRRDGEEEGKYKKEGKLSRMKRSRKKKRRRRK